MFVKSTAILILEKYHIKSKIGNEVKKMLEKLSSLSVPPGALLEQGYKILQARGAHLKYKSLCKIGSSSKEPEKL